MVVVSYLTTWLS